MRPTSWLLACILLFPVPPAHAAEAGPPTSASIENVIQKINAAQDEELWQQLTPGFQESYPLPGWRDFFRGIRARYGKLQSWTEQEPEDWWRVYRVEGENRTCIIRLAHDYKGRISGLIIRPDSSLGIGGTVWMVCMVLVFPGICRHLMGRNRDGSPGFIRPILCAMFGAAMGSVFILFPGSGPATLDRIAALAVIGAGAALIVGNNEVLASRYGRWKLQLIWALAGALFGVIWAASGRPTLEYGLTCSVVGTLVSLIFGNVGAWVHRSRPNNYSSIWAALGTGFSLYFNNLRAMAGRSRRSNGDTRLHFGFRHTYEGAAHSDGPSGDKLAELITDLRKEKNLVGLAAMVTVDGQLVASAAHGERKRDSGVSIELGDRWHIGSVTKSITATMIARLVEAGRMKWTDTIGERFVDESIHDDWKPVTLRQLLTHSAGAPPNFSFKVALKRPPLGPECTKERQEAILEVMAKKLAHEPGTKYSYSNVGYTIAGAMAESATGMSWDDLVKREVFEPLNLTGAGFGPPKSPAESLDQPRGHRGFAKLKISVDDKADNTPIIGPAGAAHMTLGDLSAFATEHLRGESGNGKLLSAHTYKQLHTPELDNYACGWVKKDPTDKIPHTTWWHNGSNTMWYALLVFIPDLNMTVTVTSNDGDIPRAESAAWAIVEDSVKQLKNTQNPED